MLNENFKLNLARLLSRACWLAGNGKDRIKIYSCEYLHAVLVYSIGLVTNNQTASKENTAKLLDHILPTVINVSCNTAHPSQQLLHSLLIQTIHFLANSKQHNSPDVQVLLKHLLSLYSGADDMAYLASKCLY